MSVDTREPRPALARRVSGQLGWFRRGLSLSAIAACLAITGSAPGRLSAAGSPSIIISEVHPAGSGNGTYNADWFELTNTGTTAVDITGWKMDDNSNAFANAVALRGVTSIPAGQSAVFLEGTADGMTDALIIGNFSTAWFGSATLPTGALVGAYGGIAVGLSTTADAVNLFDASGNRVTGVSFGASPSGTPVPTFDNTAGAGSVTLPLPAIAMPSVARANGAFVSFNGVEVGSPGRRISAMPLSTVNLSVYVRMGRFDLPEPTRTMAPPNSRLAQEASAVTYDWDTDTLFIVGDGGTSVVQVSKTGQLIDSMTLAPGGSPQGTDFFDPEGLTYVGNGRFVMSEERDRQAVLFTYVPGSTLTRSAAQTVKLGTFVDNIGIEGISYDPLTAGFIAVKETQPQGIFQTNIDLAAGTASNGSATTENSINLFDPTQAGLLDFADVYALSNLQSLTGPQFGNLLVLSQESGQIVNIDRSGHIASTLIIRSDPGNPLSVSGQQHEGLTMDFNGLLYVVSENGGGDIDHPQLWVYAPSAVPNQAPTAIALANQVNTIAENTTIAARFKVADVVTTDDQLGTNNLTVRGTDASAFEVDATGLYLKAGSVLDFEVKNSYSAFVDVDDPTVGSTPDATVAFTLAVTDVADEAPSPFTLAVTEVAPWGSGTGNTPYLADWFELTNTGADPVDITGWRMDDDSNASASGVTLNGIARIGAGESVIFIETASAATKATFLDAWFGASPPASLQVGTYSGGGVGLGTGGDAVNIFDASGRRVTGVRFGTSTTGLTFDNTAALGSATLPLPSIATLSVAGVNGSFVAADGIETGEVILGPPF